MNEIRVLDTTLRDGGYCNKWNFGYSKIKKIICGLTDAGIEIIECGFLTNKKSYEKDKTIFRRLEDALKVLPEDKRGAMYVCMINYGEYLIEELPDYTENSIDGFRVAFHKRDMEAAIKFCAEIKQKGYKVFVQPMVSLSYTEAEFLQLIEIVNKMSPYAFYIVDSFGMMKNKDLVRIFYIVENNLAQSILIGYHAHNNLQLAYSNARMLSEILTKRDMIIDSSIFGMGRGAGNLNTELYVEYLNDTRDTKYQSVILLRIIDEILMPIYNRNYWGFSLPYYVSAVNGCHPNYASFLDERKTLTIENMDHIMKKISNEEKSIYNVTYIQQLYLDFMTREKIYEERDKHFEALVEGNNVLLVAPGSSLNEQADRLTECIERNHPIIIAINFVYEKLGEDFVFISNIRRFQELDGAQGRKVIVTSNITSNDVYMKLDYVAHVSEDESVRDNAGLMLINYLSKKNVKKIFLAGFDGFSTDLEQNYIDSGMAQIANKDTIEKINVGLCKMLKKYAAIVPIEFVTDSKYIKF